ncbi:amino acid/polyamine/organocation transporter (APC superfamily) [Brevibacterium sanguinis]|uniref:Amino acid/polyamine/organocation transporter (APC superfamily) n=2 Tax=Brevibacterium TaxID=1696 RepID=A0A366IJ69_9MICO|nr:MULTISPECIES: APC family permease [Brevibacterium]RBP64926.1 amino acid/polyamine/organocation transporter (APC superfamily) [Brevibacterium sanguinis]RBP71189.1 amino acid/polyamine/organocation transporter (APC superfamily) [Brevibacterium celere]
MSDSFQPDNIEAAGVRAVDAGTVAAAVAPASTAATAPAHDYAKTLRWWDGFAISLSIPAALFINLGYALGAIGALPALVLVAIVAVLACLQNFVYSELAGIFRDRIGGIAMYANQSWRRRFTPVGPLAAFGCWFSWSSSLAIYGLQIGYLVQAEWLPSQTWSFSTGTADFGFPHLVAIVVLLAGWVLNILGMRLAMWIIYVTGVFILIPIIGFALAPFLSGEWSWSNLGSTLTASGAPGWQTAIAWMFVLAWSVYGIEAVASFVPEFKQTVSDTRRALRVAGFFVIGVYALVPLGIGGLGLEAEATENPVSFYLGAFETLIPGSSGLMTVCLIAGLMLLMVMTTADGGRVLHGSAVDGLTISQLGKLNRFKVPGVAMTLDVVVNVVLIVFVGEALAVVVAGIMGYLVCHIFALSGFLLMRRDAPNADRPIHLGPQWVPIAWALLIIDITILIVGVASAGITGYGGPREVIIGIVVLSTSVILYWYRTVVQDKQPFRLRAVGTAAEAAGPNAGPVAPEVR